VLTSTNSEAPLAVSFTPRAWRSNSSVLSDSSRARICLLTALWVRHSSVAARVKLALRPTASKVTRVSSGGR